MIRCMDVYLSCGWVMSCAGRQRHLKSNMCYATSFSGLELKTLIQTSRISVRNNYDDEGDNAESSGRLIAATLWSRLRICAKAWAGRKNRAIVQLLLNTCIRVSLE